MSNPALNSTQQAEIQKYQQMTQTLGQLHSSTVQLEGRKREIEKTLDIIKKLPEDREIYRGVGQIFYKSEIPQTVSDLDSELELLNVRVDRSKKQASEYEIEVKELEAKIRATLS